MVSMAPRQYKSRIHLLAARESPVIAILQRKRAKLFHVIAIDTKTLRITEGSWFRGKLYPKRCDLSFDGKFMVYLAMGASGKTWNGLCCIPWLTTVIDAENTGTWNGGGYFSGRRILKTNNWGPGGNTSSPKSLPFRLEAYKSRYGGEDLGVLYERFERDGFTRLGPDWGKDRRLSTGTYQVERIGDDGWGCRPSRRHPELRVWFAGYLTHGYTFGFALEEHPDLLEGATWATWDASGNLWVARSGVVQRFTLKDLGEGAPSFSLDVDRFEPPPAEPASRTRAASATRPWDPLHQARRTR
jgi:hypothetical protein